MVSSLLKKIPNVGGLSSGDPLLCRRKRPALQGICFAIGDNSPKVYC